MLKIIAGLKGSGKTKTLIEMVNKSAEESAGSVVCLEKGNALMHEIKYHVRLIDTEEYGIQSAASLMGFIAGIYASNHDVTDVYIEHALKVCSNDVKTFEEFVREIKLFADSKGFNVTMTASVNPAELSADIGAYIQ